MSFFPERIYYIAQARIQGKDQGAGPRLKFNTLSFHVNQAFILHFILPSL